MWRNWLASKQVVKFGGVACGSGSDDVPNILKATIGLPLQLVSGYKGTADVRLAFNSGEVAGLSNSWESTKSTWRKELDSGELLPDTPGDDQAASRVAQVADGAQLCENRRSQETDLDGRPRARPDACGLMFCRPRHRKIGCKSSAKRSWTR